MSCRSQREQHLGQGLSRLSRLSLLQDEVIFVLSFQNHIRSLYHDFVALFCDNGHHGASIAAAWFTFALAPIGSKSFSRCKVPLTHDACTHATVVNSVDHVRVGRKKKLLILTFGNSGHTFARRFSQYCKFACYLDLQRMLRVSICSCSSGGGPAS